jgi:CheY-like chemotaxis protein
MVFIDCLLPQTPGVDLARSIRKNFDAKILPIVMMSGIFTDKQTAKEMAQEVAALDFLKKPFEVNEVLKFLDKQTSTTSDGSLARSIFSLPDRVGSSPSQCHSIVSEINRIHGFEIPILLSALVNNSYSGVVHFLSEKGEKTKVNLSKGAIIGVECSDFQSSLGKLIVNGGWALGEDLEKALQNPQEKKIGERLVESNFMSPHAIFVAMEEQMALRIEKLVHDGYYVVNFEERIAEVSDPSIEPEQFYHLVDRLVVSRVSPQWLNQQFSTWQDYSVRMGPGHDRNRREYLVSSVAAVRDVIPSIENIGSLSSLHQTHQNHISEFNLAFYYLLCMGFVVFAEKMPQMSAGERLARLQKLWAQMKSRNLIEVFQMIGGRKDMDSREVRGVYADFAQRHLTGNQQHESDPNLRALIEAVRQKVAESYELFLDPQKLSNYERELETGRVTQRSEAQVKLDEAKKLLSMRQYSNAMVLLDKAIELMPTLDYLVLYTVWARLGLLANSKNKAKDVADLDQLMARVPQEEKISAVGNFVQGFLARLKGETAAARKFFETSVAIDKNFIEARRELNSLPTNETKKPVDLLHGDFSQVLGNFFKKS